MKLIRELYGLYKVLPHRFTDLTDELERLGLVKLYLSVPDHDKLTRVDRLGFFYIILLRGCSLSAKHYSCAVL